MAETLTENFYLNNDVLTIGRQLLGKELMHRMGSCVVSGIITETEAYAGVTDRASHAFNNRRTARTETMYMKGGHAYVYLCYGIHSLFNVVTGDEEVPDAVLIRSVFPASGFEFTTFKKMLQSGTGPGRVSKLLGIGLQHNATSLVNGNIRIVDTGIQIPEKKILALPRIGVDYAGEDAKLPYRFIIDGEYLNKLIIK